MWREQALRIVLALVGLLFTAGIYPAMMISWQRDQSGYGDAMMLSLYVTLGIFLLMAVRNPSEHRSVIAFAAWSSFAHAAVMGVMAFRDASAREYLWGVAGLAVIGAALTVLAPRKQSVERVPVAGAQGAA